MPDYPDDQYTEEEEFNDNYVEEQREMWDEAGGSYPAARKPDSLFSLFKRVWNTPDSSKVANLSLEELGNVGLSVRDCQNIAWFAGFLGHKGVNKHFKKLGEITLSTSMSKKGWFVELFVTSKKFAHKGSTNSNSTGITKEKWKIFNRSKTKPAEE